MSLWHFLFTSIIIDMLCVFVFAGKLCVTGSGKSNSPSSNLGLQLKTWSQQWQNRTIDIKKSIHTKVGKDWWFIDIMKCK